jgi:hypothetical protein
MENSERQNKADIEQGERAVKRLQGKNPTTYQKHFVQ